MLLRLIITHKKILTHVCSRTEQKLVCADGSSKDCVVDVVVKKDAGYSAGDVVRVKNGLDVKMTTEKNSCPVGYKLWAPASKADWTIVYNALGKQIGHYPRKPHLIIDVTRPDNGCGGCKEHAMKSGVPEQSAWRTTDGNLWVSE